MSLVYKVCSNSLANTRNEASIRGIKKGSVYVDNYADSVAYIHLANMEKHIKAEYLLDWAKKKWSGSSSSSTSNVYVNRQIEKNFWTA